MHKTEVTKLVSKIVNNMKGVKGAELFALLFKQDSSLEYDEIHTALEELLSKEEITKMTYVLNDYRIRSMYFPARTTFNI